MVPRKVAESRGRFNVRCIAEDPAVALKQTQICTPNWVEEVVVVPKVADATGDGEGCVAPKCLLDIRISQRRVRNMTIGDPKAIRKCLDPSCLLNRIGRSERGLHMNHASHVAQARLISEVVGPVAVGSDRSENVACAPLGATSLGPREPGVPQRVALEVIEVNMGIREAGPMSLPRYTIWTPS